MPGEYSMLGQNRGRQAERGTRPQRGKRRKLATNLQRFNQYRRDIFRGGPPSDIVDLLESDDSAQALSEEEWLDESIDSIDQNACDVSLADEDSFAEEYESDEAFVSEGDSTDHVESVIHPSNRIAITIINGQAIFRVPDWARGFADSDLDLRWQTYTRIAEWLTDNRPSFLPEPSWLNLAGTEFGLSQPVPVLQEGLYRILNLSCDVTTFSKHVRHGILLWPRRELAIEELWSQQAKLAWCAAVAKCRQKSRGYAPRSSPLGDPDMKPPRASPARNRLRSMVNRATLLDPVEFVQLLCILGDCRWSDVLSRYGNEIFFQG
jgi:hypothetical protein